MSLTGNEWCDQVCLGSWFFFQDEPSLDTESTLKGTNNFQERSLPGKGEGIGINLQIQKNI